MLQAATAGGTQVIWDLWHYGTPDWLDVFSDEFVDRFATYCRHAAELHRSETDAVPLWCPINEIAFFAFIAGECADFHPYARGRAAELKRQLVRAGIAGARALRGVDPRAMIVWCEPAINVLPNGPSATAALAAETRRESQFEVMDMLTGRDAPELGGGPDLVDVVGLNFYPHNQFVLDGGTIPMGHHAWRALSDILEEHWNRYRLPMLISETGAESSGRSAWLHYVCGEVFDAIGRGVPVEGICWYPVTDYHGWDNGRVCATGLFSCADDAGRREIDGRLADELRRQRDQLDRIRSASRMSSRAAPGFRPPAELISREPLPADA